VIVESSIVGIKMELANGALTRFNFTGEQPNGTLPTGTYRFTPPKGVTVVDPLSPI
jgi:outer membrane lipoprotein-sorting protein